MIVKNIIEKIIATIMFALIYGLIIKYTNIDVAIVCLLIQIYVELLLKENQINNLNWLFFCVFDFF